MNYGGGIQYIPSQQFLFLNLGTFSSQEQKL